MTDTPDKKPKNSSDEQKDEAGNGSFVPEAAESAVPSDTPEAEAAPKHEPRNLPVKQKPPGKPVPVDKPGRLHNVAAEFQPDALEIEERTLPGMTRWTLYTLLTLILIAIVWASLSRVDSIVVAEGKLITTAPTMVVQPLETSVIRSIDVKVGQVVKKGETLARLDPTFTEADVAQLISRRDSYEIQLDRLKAELAGKSFRVPASAPGDLRLQEVIFGQRKSQLESQLRSFDERIAQLEAGIRTQRRDREILQSRLGVLKEVEEMRTSLQQGGHSSRLSLLDAKNARLEVQRNLELARNGLEEKGHELESARAEKKSFQEEWRQKVAEELVNLQREQDGIAEQLNKAERRAEMVHLTSPSDAVVLESASRSVGSVVREAEALFTLVPLDVPLEAEVSIDAQDIGFIQVGDEVRIKFNAFPFQKHGTADGRVRTISQDAFEAEQGQGPSFYRSRIGLSFDTLRNLPPDFRFIPGMTVSAEIKVGNRTIASYFVYPFVKGLDESLREP